jgi:two-component sensor histidine kinase
MLKGAVRGVTNSLNGSEQRSSVPSKLNETPIGSTMRNITEIGSCDDSVFGEHLLLELTHRINNELTSTIGFVRLMAAQSTNDDVKVALARVIQHICDFARVYRALQIPAVDDGIDATKYLRELCQSISGAKLQHEGIELVFIESPLVLNALRCWRLAMIVSELIANASRHAFYGGGGIVQVELITNNTFVECAVTDNGSGLKNNRPGQGLKIIRSLVRDLNGAIGFRCTEWSLAMESPPPEGSFMFKANELHRRVSWGRVVTAEMSPMGPCVQRCL